MTLADQDWVVKEEAETDWEYGQRPEQRSMEDRLQNGLIIVDKPNGPTSNQVSVWTRDVLERGKTGHAGTLDPHVTGVLPIGLDRGTKVLDPLSDADKEYVCRMTLDEEIDADTVRAEAEGFVGTITQLPPKQSAVKREERDREIYTLDVLEVDGTDVLFHVHCEKGFYVRTFCEQFGEALGTTGEMTGLRRTRGGPFTEDDAVTLQEAADQYAFWTDDESNRLEEIILPVEAGIRHLKKVLVKDSAVAALTHGANLGGGGVSKLQDGIAAGERIALLTLKGELIATAHATADTQTILDQEETVAELDRVYLGNDVYPKEW